MRLLAAAALGALIAPAVQAQELPSRPLTLAAGRISVGADVSISTSTEHDDPEDPLHGAWFNYTDYEHSTVRLARIGLTTDIRLGSRLSLLGEVRTENGDRLEAYALYARLRPWPARALDIQAGRIPPTFGAFPRRIYGNGNPLIGYPLAYQYLTSLRPDAVPADTDELLRMRARGWRPSYSIGSRSVATGMPLVTAFRWDTGVQVRAGRDPVSVSAAVTTGTISDPRVGDNNGGKQISSRVQWQPLVGLVLGGSAADGAYLSDEISSSRSHERAAGVDAEYSRDYWLVRGEAIWVSFDVPTLSRSLGAASGFVEATYKIRPGLSAAARADRLTFSRVAGTTQVRSWDAPVTRIETAVSYYLQRNLILKGAYQHNWRDGGLIRTRRQIAIQLQYWL